MSIIVNYKNIFSNHFYSLFGFIGILLLYFSYENYIIDIIKKKKIRFLPNKNEYIMRIFGYIFIGIYLIKLRNYNLTQMLIPTIFILSFGIFLFIFRYIRI